MEFYRGKRVYITGGSSGIGLAAAKLLAGWGAHVALSARGKERLEEALAEVKAAAQGSDQRFMIAPHDVSDPVACEAAAKDVVAALGGVDVVIANAGVAHPARILETPVDVFEKMMRINYFGTVHTVRSYLPHLIAAKGGSIGIVSSMLGFMGIYGYTAYAASKFAQVGFADCLRQELIDHGIRLTILYPPDTDTPQLAEENRIKPPETKAISGEVKTMSAEDVALTLLKGMAKGKLHVVPGAMGRFTHFMNRHAPWVVRWVIDGELKKYRKQHPA
ncbi:MAG: SDR family oxidoreductase [Myxococcales bacterium]|nr:SDR family oxidoreductase [Myxococcales bacterium]MCB9732495.1 SDR family oxidoreductase [Deltaproteobacteria bacterium]